MGQPKVRRTGRFKVASRLAGGIQENELACENVIAHKFPGIAMKLVFPDWSPVGIGNPRPLTRIVLQV